MAAPIEAPRVLEGGARRARTLVIVLHGNTATGRPAEERAAGLLAELDGAARAAGVRLLVPAGPAPDRPDGVGWLQPEGESLVWGLVRRETASGRADRQRVSLAGHGAGGTAALTLAARHPERVAGVAAWSSAPAPVWDDEGRVVGLVEDLVSGLARVPTWIWTARDDPLLDREALGQLLAGLARADASATRPVERFRVEAAQGGHGLGSDGPREGLVFLARQRRRQRPRRRATGLSGS